jgi:hypothetical protein
VRQGLRAARKECQKLAGTVIESEQFISEESRPPYSWFEISRTLSSRSTRAVSARIYFSSRELADQAHADLVRQLSNTSQFKVVTRNENAAQTRLFTRPLVEEDGAHLTRDGMMMGIEVVGTMMSIACTNVRQYLEDVRYSPPAGFDAPKEPWTYGITAIAEIDEPYCTREMAFGVPFNSNPKPELLKRSVSGELQIQLDRAWPPFTELEVKLSNDGRITEVSSWVDFNTHELAHRQALAIVAGIKNHVEIYDDTLDGRSPILHTDPPFRDKPNNEYYGIRDHYISGLAAEVNDSERMLRLVCMRRDLRFPAEYQQFRALRDAQSNKAKK